MSAFNRHSSPYVDGGEPELPPNCPIENSSTPQLVGGMTLGDWVAPVGRLLTTGVAKPQEAVMTLTVLIEAAYLWG